MYEKWFGDEVADEFCPSGPSGCAFAEAHGMRRPSLRSRVAKDPRYVHQENKAGRPECDGGRRPRVVEMVVVEGLPVVARRPVRRRSRVLRRGRRPHGKVRHGMFSPPIWEHMGDAGGIARSGRGFRHRRVSFAIMLEGVWRTQSMSRKGARPGSAAAESFPGHPERGSCCGEGLGGTEGFEARLEGRIRRRDDGRIEMPPEGVPPAACRASRCAGTASRYGKTCACQPSVRLSTVRRRAPIFPVPDCMIGSDSTLRR